MFVVGFPFAAFQGWQMVYATAKLTKLKSVSKIMRKFAASFSNIVQLTFK